MGYCPGENIRVVGRRRKGMVVAGIPDVIEYHNFVILGRRCE